MKAIYLSIIVLALATMATAQVGYGIEGGAGTAYMRFAPLQEPIAYTTGTANPVAAVRLGGFVDVPLNRHLAFQAGAYASRKGAVRSFSYYINDSFHESVHQTLELYYAQLPLMLLYKFGMQGRGRLVAGIGAELGYIIGGRNKLADEYTSYGVGTANSGSYPLSLGNTVRGFDLGLALTAGYELPTGLFFRGTFTAGAQDIGVGTEIDKNRTWVLTAGYIFGRGRNINKEVDELIDHSEVKSKN